MSKMDVSSDLQLLPAIFLYDFTLSSSLLYIAGLNFGAILLKPYNLPERRKSPLVVNIHGKTDNCFVHDVIISQT